MPEVYWVSFIRKKISEAKIGSAEHEAKRILNDAMKAAESKKKESLIEAKEEILKTRNEAEREIKDRRADLQRQERRLPVPRRNSSTSAPPVLKRRRRRWKNA